MLTDIFSKRYASVLLFPEFTEKERRLLFQSMRLVRDLMPCPATASKTSDALRAYWEDIEKRISTELGLLQLSARWQNGYEWPPDMICQNWALSMPANGVVDDTVLKERLSLIELALRKRGEMIATANANLEQQCADYLRERKIMGRGSGLTLLGNPTEWIRTKNKEMNDQFVAAIAELNIRFQEAGAHLHYHNGFIQQSNDSLLARDIEEPFWRLVSDKKWENVDHDMKEAIDLYDSGGRDPAWYAARALESTIKIISNTQKWTHGKETGASNFVDNLVSKANGRFIAVWEAEILKDFFTKVRNPFGHGPGEEPMPALTPEQTLWTIRTCMAWVTTLVTRMKI